MEAHEHENRRSWALIISTEAGQQVTLLRSGPCIRWACTEGRATRRKDGVAPAGSRVGVDWSLAVRPARAQVAWRVVSVDA
eukprot:1079255-Prymnesium_polylepis.1